MSSFDAVAFGKPPGGPERLAGRTIVVDPGHPSETSSGGVVQNGTTEVHICWLVAIKLRDVLQSAGANVVMTKTAEHQYIPNRERARIANQAKAALFLRLHCDAAKNRGFTVYYPDRPGRSRGRTGPSRNVIQASSHAASLFHEGLASALQGYLKDNGIRGDSATLVGRRKGALTGSVFSEVPVVTVEMCVLADARDAAFIKSASGQCIMAQALASGVRSCLGSKGEGIR